MSFNTTIYLYFLDKINLPLYIDTRRFFYRSILCELQITKEISFQILYRLDCHNRDECR